MLNQPFLIPALLFLILAPLFIFGLVPRQWAIGIRTPKTLSDDTIWLRANRFGGWVLLCSSLIYLVVAWMLPCTAPCGMNLAQWLLHVGAFGLPLLIGIVLALRYAQTV